MAFGGAPVNGTGAVGNEGPPANTLTITGLTLAAFAAAPAAIANADTGELTTGVPAANQTQLLATFGRGAGNWAANDVNLVDVSVVERDDATQGGAGQLPSPHLAEAANGGINVVAGQLVIRIHNRGLTACGDLRIRIRFEHSLIR